MSKPKPINFLFRLEALAWNAYVGGMGALGLERASRFGAAVLPFVGAATSAHKTALRNIRMAFPNESDAWHRELRTEMWAEVGRMSGEFPHMGKFLDKYNNSEVVFEGRERVEATLGKGAVFIGGHFTNWEVTSLCLAQTDRTCHFTYRPANNPIIDKYIVDTRAAFGLALQAAKGQEGGMGLLRSLKRGRSVALMNDQKYNMGLSVPFFGYECMTADGPTRLALKFKVPLIPITGRRIEGQRFVATAYEPIALDYDKPDDEQTVYNGVKRVNEFMEARVREAPAQWFWAHRRWGKDAWVKAGVMGGRLPHGVRYDLDRKILTTGEEAMNIDVYDTYATSKAGKTIHFDVFLPSGGDKETALRYAHAFLESIGETAEALKSERCNFCHSERAHPAVEAEVAKSGHYILQMEGCPNPHR